MNKQDLRELASDLLRSANITLNGTNPWDIQILNQDFYQRVFSQGSLGLGEAYIDHWWDCDRLDIFFEKIIKADLESKIKTRKWVLIKLLLARFLNMQTKKRAWIVGRKHYDLGNDLYSCMLDTRMNYTCGYWRNANTLDEAQKNKLELTCQKLKLKSGMRLLDIGCGFGALAKYAAKHYGVSVVGITISREQQEYAKQNCAGLPVEIRLQDYRDLNEKFDRIASLGMFEHVGQLNYRAYMQIARNCLTDDGIFLLHTIGNNVSTTAANEWINKYIFPNGMLPSITQIGKASEGLFVMEDWENFGAYYDKTLMAWFANFDKHWEQLKNKYDDRFYRMWSYYLLSCAGMFRARATQLWQIVFSKQGITGGYHPPLRELKSGNEASIEVIGF